MATKSVGEANSSATLQSSSHTIESEKSTSGSDKSNEDKVELKEKDHDLTRDNSASPIDLECHIQAERITKILDEALYKTKLAICLPKMVQHYRVLSTRLSPQHMDDLIFIFEQYENPLFSASLLNMAAMDDIKAGDTSLKNRLNPELGHLLYIMNSYPSLRGNVEEMVAQMREEYLAEGEDKSPIACLEYLLGFERFRDLMVKQMATTAAEELTEKLKVKKLEDSNEKLTAKIHELTETIRTEQEHFDKTMSAKTELIAKLEQELQFLNHATSIKLKKKVLDSDRQMVLMSRTHAIKNEMLKEEEVETREGYDHLLNHHLIDEKNQRARRFKVETQLLSWLQKYDNEMTDKQFELDELERKYEEEVKKCEELEERLAEQDKEYIPLMKEREDEYHAEMTAKMNAFLLEHAAKVIQTAWRDVLANRAEKRKLKKLWKQVKAQRDAAEKKKEREEKAAQKAAAKQAAKEKAAAKKKK